MHIHIETIVFSYNVSLMTFGSLFCSQRTVQETKGWDVFRDPPIKEESGSMANQECLKITVKILKLCAYIITFIIVLASGVISKGTLLFMTSQISPDKVLSYCNKDLGWYHISLIQMR